MTTSAPRLRVVGLAAVALLAGCVAPDPPVHNAGISTVRVAQRDWSFLTLGPNDVVRVTVQNHPELSSPVDGARVDSEGILHLPQVGGLRAKGRTVAELNALLQEEYAKVLQRPIVSASVLEYRSRSFHLLGHFAHTGVVYMDRPLSALEAAALGGPVLPGADRENLYLLRPHEDRLEVHHFDLETPGPDGLVQVLPGDLVFARPTGSWSLQEALLPWLEGLGFNLRNLVETPVIE